MVGQHEVQDLTLKKVAINLCVDTSTVYRVVKQFETAGTVSKKPHLVPNHSSIKLTKPVQLAVLHLVLSKPRDYLWETQQELKWMFALDVKSSCSLSPTVQS